MPKRKAGLFSTDDARRKTARVELERYGRLRTTRVAACCEGKGGYFKKSGCRRTERRIAACGTKIDAKRHSTLRDVESPHRRSIRLQIYAIENRTYYSCSPYKCLLDELKNTVISTFAIILCIPDFAVLFRLSFYQARQCSCFVAIYFTPWPN